MERESPGPSWSLNDAQSYAWLSLLSLPQVCVFSGMRKTLAEAFRLRISQAHIAGSVNNSKKTRWRTWLHNCGLSRTLRLNPGEVLFPWPLPGGCGLNINIYPYWRLNSTPLPNKQSIGICYIQVDLYLPTYLLLQSLTGLRQGKPPLLRAPEAVPSMGVTELVALDCGWQGKRISQAPMDQCLTYLASSAVEGSQ